MGHKRRFKRLIIQRFVNSKDSAAFGQWLEKNADFCENGEDGPHRRVWLGTWMGLSPSGKIYAPFASSNVAGCPMCKGTGSKGALRGLIIGRRRRSWAYEWDPTTRRFHRPSARNRRRAKPVSRGAGCSACGGQGSREAFFDECWREALEELAEECGWSVDYYDYSIALVQAVDTSEE